MKKYYLFFILLIGVMVSCDDDDEPIAVKDYNLKTFSADYNYDPEAAHGEVNYKNQVYFNLSTGENVSTEVYGTDGWTHFYLIEDSAATNFTSDVQDWDIVFTNYTTNLGTDDAPIPYGVTGVLINIEEGIEVASYIYEDSEDSNDISEAFVNLSLADVQGIDYSDDIDAIGHEWKTYDFDSKVYILSSNHFYIVKVDDENYYKVRFTSFYGESTDERIATIQYQLMQ